MAATESPVGEATLIEPHREVCGGCSRPVLVAMVRGARIVADPHEWEPRASCYVCSTIKARGQRRTNCDRCGGCGYVGSKRPPGTLLAVDVAWSDGGHVRTVGPRTPRRKGEALHELHCCVPLALAA